MAGQLGNNIAQQHGDAAHQHRRRHQDTMVGIAGQHAGYVRNRNADEADRATESGDCSGQQGCAGEEQKADPANVKSHGAGIVLS